MSYCTPVSSQASTPLSRDAASPFPADDVVKPRRPAPIRLAPVIAAAPAPASVVKACLNYWWRPSARKALKADQVEATPAPKQRPRPGPIRAIRGRFRKACTSPTTPDSFWLTLQPKPLQTKATICGESLAGKPKERRPPSRKELETYGLSVARWLETLPWFQEQTLETATDAFLFCVERGLVETYFSMRLVALAALLASAKYHELVESIKLREIVALTEGVERHEVRKAEVALLEILNFDIMAAGRHRLPSDPDTPTGVQDLGAELKRQEAVKAAPGLPAVV